MCRRSSYSRLDCKNIVTDWRQVVWQHGHIVWQMAYRLLGNHADAPDCFQNDHLRLALTRLPDGQAEAFCLRCVEGMSYEEIAKRLEVQTNHDQDSRQRKNALVEYTPQNQPRQRIHDVRATQKRMAFSMHALSTTLLQSANVEPTLVAPSGARS